MNGRILIFSGTTEGRRLAELLAGAGISALVCVATEYGKEVMRNLPGIELRQGRINTEEMFSLMQSENFSVVVDATHPFATEVSKNIRAAAEKAHIKHLRLQRSTDAYRNLPQKGKEKSIAEVVYFETNEACAKALMKTEGNILLTVGSKELLSYCNLEGLKERLVVRVLPSEDSLAVCREHHLTGKQIIAMQGPFSEKMNRALIQEYDISCLVTKESGITGGFEEKASAAWKEECSLFVIGNPEKETGLSFCEVCSELENIIGIKFPSPKSIHISIIGIGMGNIGTLTVYAKEEISHAHYLFGAKRVLECVEDWKIAKHGKKAYPYYLAEDIIPVLDRIFDDAGQSDNVDGTVRVAVLFSGDSGFYSGAQKLYQAFGKWKEQYAGDVYIKIYPGISSVSYLAAKCGISWQDAKIMSIHGRGSRENWEPEVIAAVHHNPKVFLLVSGVDDVHTIGDILIENAVETCRILVGFQLSYPDEKIIECTPAQCKDIQEGGSYTLMVLNQACKKKFLAPFRADLEFIRGKAPMTKAEIRALVICKMKLTENAIVYDIGSGTGSVAIEIAERSEFIHVFAVEHKAEAVDLICSNQRKFAVPNITVIPGKAPEALRELPTPTHVFIGGSSGNMKEIITELYQRNNGMRIVITAVTMETIAKLQEIMRTFLVENAEMIQIQVSKAEQIGQYHLLKAENPVTICSFDICGK